MIKRINLKSCLVAAGVALALAAGAASAQSGTSQPPESPPTATPPSSAPPADQQAPPSTVPPTASTPAPPSAVPPTDRPPMATTTPISQIAKFEDLDLNKDSGLTKDEVIGDTALLSSFATYDTNGDGKLSAEEFAKYKSSKQLGRAKSDEPDPNKR